MAGRTLAILDCMQYLSERLLADEDGEIAGGRERTSPRWSSAQQPSALLAATEQLMAERGCAGTTIERIARQARVSSVTFYDHFASKEEAFVAAFERAVDEGRARPGPGGAGQPALARAGPRRACGRCWR